MYADGTLASRAHPALRGAGVLLSRAACDGRAGRAIAGKRELASQLRLEALQLRMRFQEDFWDSDGGFVALALAGQDRNARALVKASNMGHCLWAQASAPEHARAVADILLSRTRCSSGYGIRTLADTEVAFNPLSYHNGSIWPHDNSIIMEGLRFYGFERPSRQDAARA